jgi:hypothetical protein
MLPEGRMAFRNADVSAPRAHPVPDQQAGKTGMCEIEAIAFPVPLPCGPSGAINFVMESSRVIH